MIKAKVIFTHAEKCSVDDTFLVDYSSSLHLKGSNITFFSLPHDGNGEKISHLVYMLQAETNEIGFKLFVQQNFVK